MGLTFSAAISLFKGRTPSFISVTRCISGMTWLCTRCGTFGDRAAMGSGSACCCCWALISGVVSKNKKVVGCGMNKIGKNSPHFIRGALFVCSFP